MINPKLFQFDTLSLHAGQQPDPVTGQGRSPSTKRPPSSFETQIMLLRYLTWSEQGISIREYRTRLSQFWKSVWQRWRVELARWQPHPDRRRFI